MGIRRLDEHVLQGSIGNEFLELLLNADTGFKFQVLDLTAIECAQWDPVFEFDRCGNFSDGHISYPDEVGVKRLDIRFTQVTFIQHPNNSQNPSRVVGEPRNYALTDLQNDSCFLSETYQCGVQIAPPLPILASLFDLKSDKDAKHNHEHLDAISDVSGQVQRHRASR